MYQHVAEEYSEVVPLLIVEPSGKLCRETCLLVVVECSDEVKDVLQCGPVVVVLLQQESAVAVIAVAEDGLGCWQRGCNWSLVFEVVRHRLVLLHYLTLLLPGLLMLVGAGSSLATGACSILLVM